MDFLKAISSIHNLVFKISLKSWIVDSVATNPFWSIFCTKLSATSQVRASLIGVDPTL